MAEKISLSESISKAAAEQGIITDESDENQDQTSDSSKPKEDTKPVEKPIEKPQEKPEETGASEEDEEIAIAVELFRALKDPAQSADIIRRMAIQSGVIKEAPTGQTQAQVKAEAKELKDIISEVLGEEYPDLKDKLHTIMKAVQDRSAQEINTLKAELQHERMQEAQGKFEAEFESFIKTNKVDEDTANLMLKEMQVLPPSNTGKNRLTLTAYLTRIHRLATSNHTEARQSVEQDRRRKENLAERSQNLSSDVDDSRIKTGSKRPTLRESIAAAARGETFDHS